MSNEEERLRDKVLNLMEQLNHANVRIEGFERMERTFRAEVDKLEGAIRTQEKIIKKLVDKLG